MVELRNVQELEELLGKNPTLVVFKHLDTSVQSKEAYERLVVGEQAGAFTVYVARDPKSSLWAYLKHRSVVGDVEHQVPQVLIYLGRKLAAHASQKAVTAEWVVGKLAVLEP